MLIFEVKSELSCIELLLNLSFHNFQQKLNFFIDSRVLNATS
jgi:hypothetical protein